MTTNIGDIYMHCDAPHLILDITVNRNKVYTFDVLNLFTNESGKWTEPFNQQLNSLYWEFLA